MPQKILVVEDEKPLSDALEMKLKGAGFEVALAYNGKEALDAILGGGFDLILLDLIIPKIDGFSVLSEMKITENDTPVIVTSNLSQVEDIDRAKNLGAQDYLIKSNTSLDDIIEQVKKTLS